MSSEALARFKASTAIDFERWHDGVPYDLAALDQMTEGERHEVARSLVAKATLDWRDVEALQRIGSPQALQRIREAAAKQTDGGGAAALAAEAAGRSEDAEAQLLEKLRSARLMEQSLDRLFEMAEAHPTPRVRAELFRLATQPAGETRYAFGAFLLYLNGHSEDWYGFGPHRTMLLTITHGDGDDRRDAIERLRALCDTPAGTTA